MLYDWMDLASEGGFLTFSVSPIPIKISCRVCLSKFDLRYVIA